MNTILVILGLLLIGVAVTFYLIKTGKVEDSDGDFIPDAVEEAVEDVKKTVKEVKRRAHRVKEEIRDVVEEAKDVIEQVDDVVEAAKGKARRGRRPRNKKSAANTSSQTKAKK